MDESGSDEEVKGGFELKINKDYAANYEKWRAKEEYQKLKDKYGDVKLEDESGESESSSSEDEDAEKLTPMMEKDFLRTLAALKSHDPKIYDTSVKFFDVKSNDTKALAVEKPKKMKPMYLKDYEREIILKKDGKFSDDEDVSDKEEIQKPLNYYEEQDAIRQSFKNSYSSDEDGDNLLSVRAKSKAEQEKEEEEYLEWLKGQKEEVSTDKSIVAELKPLRQYWADPSLDEGEQFLRDYLLQKQYLEEDDEKCIPSYDEVIRELEEDEKELDKEEQFEKKYNFRFEEPDAEVIKSFPRAIPESLRNKDTRRVEQRQKVRERKKLEETKKREEIKRLKNMKKMEILNKIEKLREVTGSSVLGISENDIDEDFDAEQYDKMMKKAFSEDYYGEEEDEKPVFSDMEDDEPNWNEWTGPEQEQGYGQEETDIHCDDPDFVMDCDYNPNLRRPKVKPESKKKKKSSFAVAVEKPKPVFDSKFKSFDEYFNEYYKLDYEDIVGDLPVRFKYREVIPNDFGLSVDEILSAPDKELNAWVSVKKMSQYRTEDEEVRDKRVFHKKGRSIQSKKNILTSLWAEKQEDNALPPPVSATAKLKKRRHNEIGGEELQPMQKKTKKKQSVDEVYVKVELTKKDDDEITKTTEKKKKKNKLVEVEAEVKTEKSDNLSKNTTNVQSSQDVSELNQSVCDVKEKKKKKKKKKRENIDFVKPVDTLSSKTVKDTDEKTVVKRTKPRRKNKLPPISDDRLKAYGISVKKFKYCHAKKLLKEQLQ